MIRTLHQISLLGFLLIFGVHSTWAQDDLMELLDKETSDTGQDSYTQATFKSTRVINGHSIETRSSGVLEFLISHRFGRINDGINEFFGLDQSNIRFGLEYGITDRLNVGIGRSSFQKQYDGFVKYKLLRQSEEIAGSPASLVFLGNIMINSQPDAPDRDLNFTNRSTYALQAMLARKFSSNFSLQITPTMVHKNLVPTPTDDNDVFALGVGARQKITNRFALTAEYFYRLNTESNDPFHNAIAIGVDIETGGHVFQLHLTNAQAMIEKGFVTESTGDFFDGDIHFGFNISRVFTLSPKE